MGCQFWLNENGQLIEDENGAIVLSEDCPCGNCCDRLSKQIAALLRETVQTCIPCDEQYWFDDCGECYVTTDEQEGVTSYGRYVTKRKNRIISFSCDTGFILSQTDQPPQEGDIVTVTFCDNKTATTSYSTNPSLTCLTDDPCCIFTHMYCAVGSEGHEKLYPILEAPDYPSSFGSAQALCEQRYWKNCFNKNPVKYVTCAAQVIAPRCWFDDYQQPTGEDPDMTFVWGVIGCFCEGEGKWEIMAVQGGGAGLIVVDAPFTADRVPLLDSNGNPALDSDNEPVTVVKCDINCDGLKSMVDEMTRHYQYNSNGSVNAMFATTSVDDWYTWTGQTVTSTCFWGYVPLSAVYGYRCTSGTGLYWHYIVFDCSCVMGEKTVEGTGLMNLPDAGLYEVVAGKDLCTVTCPVLWAVMSYAKGENWNTSQPYTDVNDPRDTGEGGVILTEDSRVPGGGIYSIGGSACIYAAWSTSDKMILWVDCNCGLHVGCMPLGTEYRFLKSVDPCICVDFRELVDTNPSIFGVVDKEWGSHTLINWTHTDTSANWSGPYWIFDGQVINRSDPCQDCGDDIKYERSSFVQGGYIDYNMLVVHRIVAGEHEVGHVMNSGGIYNLRLASSGIGMSGITSASIGIIRDPGVLQRAVYVGECPNSNGCPDGGWVGWYVAGMSYNASARHGTSPDPCPCDPSQAETPICSDHSKKLSIDTIFFSAGYFGTYCFYTTVAGGIVKGSTEGYEQKYSDSCVCYNWVPGSYTWTMFSVQYANTSCGLVTRGDNNSLIYLKQIEIPGYSGIEPTIIQKIQQEYGWYFDTIIGGGYPYYDNIIYGVVFNETRNSRGTLISYTVTGSPPRGSQPPLCHTPSCSGKSVYNDIRAFCSAYPSSDPCRCINSSSTQYCE